MPPHLTTHDRAALLSIGDELALGQALDTNSKWLAERLMALGIPTVEHVIIPDDLEQHAAALIRLSQLAPLIISTGGLGPTLDDLTRDALAKVLNEPLVTDERALAALEQRFAARGRTLSDNQRTQALRPTSATCLPNPHGTAPGLHALLDLPPQRGGRNISAASSRRDEREAATPTELADAHPTTPSSSDLFCLPGPPGEMKPMFEAQVVPRLRPPTGRVVRTRFLQVIGIGEGDAAAAVGPLMNRDRNPLVGITASGAQLTWRIRYEGTEAEGGRDADAKLNETESLIRAALGPNIFAAGEVSLAQAVLGALSTRHKTLGTVESCTGGLLGELITAVPGASARYRGGLVTYSNELKTALADVPAATVTAHGAVSRETAEAMAAGGLNRLGVDECLAITGIAGPDGGTPTKPVGTVWISLASRAATPSAPPRVAARRFLVSGDRDEIRLRAARTALGMLWLSLQNALDGRRLLFEQP